jgi:hypothetical protein
MALLTVSGEPGCPAGEVARLTAQRLQFDLFTEADLRRTIEREFGPRTVVPDRAWPHLLASVLARLAAARHLVACVPGAEFLLREYAGVLRAALIAGPGFRAGALMVDRGVERRTAGELLARLDREEKESRRRRFGRGRVPPHLFDLTLNAASADSDELAGLLAAAAACRNLAGQGLLSAPLEAEIQFRARLQLARHRLRPPGEVGIPRREFGHPSEEIFASLLDFYRIQWEYEPRSFPLRRDGAGNVIEAFTPDFYLPEFDLYVELTTMKQAHVTRKNRKLRLMKKIYPDVSVQIFYQKDFQNLIFKYGLDHRLAHP